MKNILSLGVLIILLIWGNASWAASISGTRLVCTGSTTTLSIDTTGGAWSSSNAARATVDASTGVVTGITNGSVVISYTAGTYVFTAVVSVNATPIAIVGAAAVCEGANLSLSNPMGGGTWSSADAAIGSVGATTGIVRGIAAGDVTITYHYWNGCNTTKNITVNPAPAAFSGSLAFCAGTTSTLSSSPSGGTWTSSNNAVATVNASGVVTGVIGGLSVISYTTGGACKTGATVTVANTPAAITGNTTICAGSTSMLASATAGGAWSSANTAVATVGTNGLVTGVSAGTAIITYGFGSGCARTTTVTVTPPISAISGAEVLCAGLATTYTNATTGGTWTSSNTARLTISAATGMASAVSAGTATITYRTSTACFITKNVTVNTALAAITGGTSVCMGATATLSHPVSGGTWTSSNTARATIDAATGALTGVSLGTAVITYTIGAACFKTITINVTALSSAITGTATVCEGGITTLSNATAGGSWSSSNPAVATVAYSVGNVTGVATGTATISYTLGSGCAATRVVTVSAGIAPFTGATAVCTGFSTTLATTTTGGTWSSSNTARATINAAGLVTGLTAGTVVISYAKAGCVRTTVFTVSGAPSAISGTATVCVGNSTTLSATAGGSWTSANTSIASIGSSSGVMTGVAAGTTTISYTITGCTVTRIVTINETPSTITGTLAGCVGTTATLSSTPAGGSWTSSNTAIATVDAAGVVTNLLAGVSNIVYTLPGGCSKTAALTVNAAPAAISGADAICNGTSASYTSATSGGAWTSSNTAVATVGTGGVVTALSAGTATLTYGVGSCITTKTITVNNAPAAITGGTTVCAGATTMLANATAGGSWASANTAVATVGSTGMVTGVSAGTATISYTASGCGVAMVITVNNTPAAISGADAICNGTSASYTSATSGGAWTSSNTSVATVGTGGVVNALSAGTTTLSYFLGTCGVIKTITVNNTPAAITGSTTVCAGATTMLANATAGGSWASANTAVATVGSTGMVTGVSAGTANISYTLAGGCTATTVVSVNATAPITGPSSIAIGGTATLANAIAGGSWSSDKEFVATVGATTGVVSGVSAGSCAISYALPSGCAVVRDITVSSGCTISGTLAICRSTTSALSASVSGGTWSSSTTSVATVNGSTGVVSGVNAGTATISYNSGTGCTSSVVVTINANPATIGGPSIVCGSAPINFTNATAGGAWTSSNTALATIGSTTGDLIAAAAGTVVITYTLPTGCRSTKSVTLITSLSPISVTGGNRCEGNLFNVGNVIMGGTWTAADTNVAQLVTVFGSYASFRAMNAGVTNISFTAPGGCISIVSVTTNTTPAVISGGNAVCIGATTTLSTTPTGGTWTSSNADMVSVGSATGVVSGDRLGTATITYTLANGCNRTNNVTVGGAGSAGVIYAPNVLAFGEHAFIENTGYSGSWVNTDTSIITNPEHLIIWPLNPGTTTIMYTTAIGTCTPDTASVTVTVPDNICSKELVALKGNLFRTGGIDYYYNVKNLYLSGEYSNEMFGVVTSINYGYYGYNGGANLKIFKTNGDKTIFLRNNINEARWGDAIHRTTSGRIFGIMYHNINTIDAYEIKDTGYVYSVVETALTDTYYPTYENYRSFQLTSSVTDTVYVSYINYIEGAVYVKKYNGTSWELVGVPIHDTNINEISSFKVSPEGELLLSYITYNNTYEDPNTNLKIIKYNGAEWINVTSINKTTPYSKFISYIKDDKNIAAVYANEVLQYNGTEWITIGELESLSADDHHMNTYGDIEINTDNSVTIALPRFNSSSSIIELIINKYDGTSWNDISINSISLSYSKIELSHTINGNLYIGLQGTELKQPIYERDRTMIFKFNGTNWQETPGDDYIDVNESSKISTILSNNTPIVGYLNGNTYYGGDLKNKIWDGTRWKTINLPETHLAGVNQFKLFKDSSETIYQVVSTRGAGNKLDMYRYHDSGWSRIGSSSITPAGVNLFDAVCGSGNMPWLIFKDSTMANATTIKKYNGSSWVTVSSSGLPVFINKISLAFDTAGVAYVAGLNQYTNKITAYKFNGSSWVAIDSNKWKQGHTPQLAFTNKGMMLTYVGGFDSYNPCVYAKLISDTFSSKFAQDSMLGLGTDWYTSDANFNYDYNLTVDKIGTPYITGSSKGSDYYTRISQFVLSGNCWVENDLGRGAMFYDKRGTNISTSFDSSNRMYISGLFFCPLDNWSSPVYLPSVYKYENKSIKGDSIICANQINTFKAQKFTYEGIPNSYSISGTWSISNPAVARITPYVFNSYDYGLEISHTGYVTGLTPGTATISFTYPGGCVLTKTITVNGVPSMPTVSGATTVAVGGATTLSASTTGGDWYSSNNAMASVDSTGVVSGVSAGSAVITYIKFEECGLTYDLHTINVTPARPTVVNNTDAADMLHAYPNPTKGALFVNTATTGTLTMMTLDGKEVSNWKLSTGETALTLPKSMATGLYICKFIGTDGATKIIRLVYEQ